MKPLVLMICAHEPTMDPRIRWEAEGAAKRFDVVVVGFNREDGSLPAEERSGGYAIYRLPCARAPLMTYVVDLARALGGVGGLLFLATAIVLALPVSLADIALRVLRRGWRMISGRTLPGSWTRLSQLLGTFRSQFAPATSAFGRYIERMPRKPEVLHCNDLDTLLVGVLASRRFGCKVVYDAHEYYPHSDPHAGWLERTLFHLLERCLARRVDSVVTVNHWLADAMRKAYGLREVLSVPNAEPWSAHRAPSGASAMHALAAGRVKFLFQGRFSPGRGVEELVTGWAGADPSKAALFLRGPDNAWRRDLMSLAGRLGVLDRSVFFLDAIQEDELVAGSAEADVGIIPYKGEIEGYKYACPNKLSQYLHAGLVVLTNDLPYVREVVEDSGAGLHYSSENLDSLVAAVERIAGDAEFRRRCRENALRYAREKFNWQAFSETLYALYERAPQARNAKTCAASPAS